MPPSHLPLDTQILDTAMETLELRLAATIADAFAVERAERRCFEGRLLALVGAAGLTAALAVTLAFVSWRWLKRCG